MYTGQIQKKIEKIATDGIWIGILDDIEGMMKDDSLFLNHGDTMLLYTDGITESVRNDKEMEKRSKGKDRYGDERLKKTLCDSAQKPVNEIVDDVIESMNNYTWSDDVTMVVVKRVG